MRRRTPTPLRRLIALVACIALVAGLVPTPALAEALEGAMPDLVEDAPVVNDEVLASLGEAGEGDVAADDTAMADDASVSADDDMPEAPVSNIEAIPAAQAAPDAGEGSEDTEPSLGTAPAQAPACPAFEQAVEVDGVKVTVSAPEGVFPEGARLSVTSVPSSRVENAVAGERDAGVTVAAAYTFDVKVIDAAGNELQPAEGQVVSVSFRTAEVADANLDAQVYHITDDGSAQALATNTAGKIATAQTDGFSLYTVEFTYGDLQYVLPGGDSMALSTILETVGLSGEVTAVICSDESLFSVSKETGAWVVSSHAAFTSTEWMRVTIAGIEYEIAVTDATFGNWEYEIADGKATITKYNGSASTVTIPSELGDCSVTTIGTAAFESRSSLQSVTIPDSVESIGQNAFRNCSDLQSVTVGSGVKSIGSWAFQACVNLQEVHISDLAAWCQIAFADDASNPLGRGAGKLYLGGNLVTELTIADGVESIGAYAFYRCSSIESVTIPDSVESIGAYAFMDCDGLTSVTIPDSVESIGAYAFCDCVGLTSVTIGSGVESIGAYAFSDCDGLTSVTIPDSVERIGEDAFEYCPNLSNVWFVGAAEEWNKLNVSFYNSNPQVHCLPSVTVTVSPDGAGTVSRTYRAGEDSHSVTVTAEPSEGYVFANWTGDRTGTDPELVIDGLQFQKLSSTDSYSLIANFVRGKLCGDGVVWTLENGTLSIRYIGRGTGKMTDFAFQKAPWYADRASIQTVDIGDGVTGIGAYAFEGCASLGTVTIPADVTSIGNYAFYHSGLESVTIPTGVESIGINAFAFCPRMTEIVVAGDNPNYSSLDGILYDKAKTELITAPTGLGGELTIPDSVTSIGELAFYNNDNITSVIIPASVTSIGGYAFSDCGKLSDLYYASSQGDWNNKVTKDRFWDRETVRKVIHFAVTLAASASPKAGGTVTVSCDTTCPVEGKVWTGTSATVAATPNAGYEFTGWTENGSVVSTNAAYSFTVEGDRSLVAVFISKPVLTITALPQGGTYTGQTQGEGDTVYEDQAEIASKVSVKGLRSGDLLENIKLFSQGTDADDYRITVSSARVVNASGKPVTDDYKIVYVPGTFTINPAEVTITVASASKSYGKSDPEFTGTVEGLVAAGDLGEVKYSRTNRDAEDADTYQGVLTATYQPNKNYDVTVVPGDFTINPAPASALGLTAVGGKWTYDAAAHAGSATVTVTKGTSVEYSVDGKKWAAEPPSITDAGSLAFQARATNRNYQTATTDATLVVDPAKVTVTANAASKQFATADPALSASVKGNLNGDPIAYEVTRPGTGTDEAVGTYKDAIVASGKAAQGNYAVTFAPADFTITENTSALTLTASDGGGAYTGSAYGLTDVSASLADAKVEYRVGSGTWSTTAPTVTDVADSLVGTVSARATLEGYAPAQVDGLSIVVNPRSVTVTADGASKVHGDGDPKLSATVEGTIGSDTVSYDLSRDPGDDVGKYAITASGATDQGNYTVSYEPGTLEITPAPATITVANASKVVGEDDPTITGSVEGLVKEGDLGEVSYSRVGKDEDPGTYRGVLTATYQANKNYDVTVVPGDFTIRALLTLRWLDGDGNVLQEKTYVEGDPAPAYDGAEPTKKPTAQYTYAFVNWDDGTVEGAVTTYRPLFDATVNEYDITLDLAGGTLDGQTGTVTWARPYGSTITLPEPTREGYVFKYWKGSRYNAGDKYVVEGAHTFAAVWEKEAEPATHTVTFDANGHGTAPAAQKVGEGSKVTKPADPTASGWTFGGWFTDKACTEAYDFSKPVTSDLTLYAKWTEKSSPAPTPGSSDPVRPGSSSQLVPSTGDPNADLSRVLPLVAASGLCLVLAGVILRRRRKVRGNQ